LSETIPNDVLSILKNSTIDGLLLKLPEGQLDRKMYEAVAEVLKRCGAKWKGGKISAHVFEVDTVHMYKATVETGIMPPKNPLAFFPTPKEVVIQMLGAAYPSRGDKVLEPSAGRGGIVDVLIDEVPGLDITCVELDPVNAGILRSKGYHTHELDFLQFDTKDRYDAIYMNPPFSVKGDPHAYITHIEHAFKFLKQDGLLVAIAPNGFETNTQRRCQEFRDMIAANSGTWVALESGSFKGSGTMVNTVIVVMTREETENVSQTENVAEVAQPSLFEVAA
jgi:predicted RNA methylase